jgi:hypothetical protein
VGDLPSEANAYLTGWVTYFPYADAHSQLRGLDAPAYAGCAACGSSSASSPRDCGDSCVNTGCRHDQPANWPPSAEAWQFAARKDRHEHRLVRPTRADQPDSPPCRTKRPGKPPWYVVRTPGGVRGGNREEPPYSIADAISPRAVGGRETLVTQSTADVRYGIH